MIRNNSVKESMADKGCASPPSEDALTDSVLRAALVATTVEKYDWLCCRVTSRHWECWKRSTGTRAMTSSSPGRVPTPHR